MNAIPSTAARVFWLALPPMKPAARLNAAQLVLRGRVSVSPTTMLALGASAHANGQWLALVWDAATHSLNENAIANAALTPWSPNSVSWRRDAHDPHCITSQGTSVSLEQVAGESALPDALVQACGAVGVTRLEIFGDATPDERTQWAAQLGVAVNTNLAIDNVPREDAAMPRFAAGKILLSGATPRTAAFTALTTGLSPWVAAIAGLAYASFGALHWWTAQRALEMSRAQQTATMASLQQTDTTWNAWLKTNHPAQSRGSASSLLELTLPALSATVGTVKTIGYEARALNIEWSTLTAAEREAFAQTLAVRGLGVVSAGNKARVMWP